jgi:cell division initiation protein
MQRLTPLDIQKQTFSRSFKGYSSDEVHAYLHLVAEELEEVLKDLERLTRENATLREEIGDHNDRERMLKDTLLSAQKVSEEVKENARKEAELIVKDAELLSDRIMGQTMSRVGELERTIQELKMQRKAARSKLESTIDLFQQAILVDTEQEATEAPLTHIFRKVTES